MPKDIVAKEIGGGGTTMRGAYLAHRAAHNPTPNQVEMEGHCPVLNWPGLACPGPRERDSARGATLATACIG
eukprot:6841219-Pyramimonas_sp.AAC.1